MPCGPFTIRREETGFRKEKREQYVRAGQWLDWLIHKEGRHIQHAFNGREKYIEPFYVDGYCGENQTMYIYTDVSTSIRTDSHSVTVQFPFSYTYS